MLKKILIINGPNLNMLGSREMDIYGNLTLEEINNNLKEEAKRLPVEIGFFQSNHEGEIIDEIQKTVGRYDAIIINAGALTHYSYSIRDALKAVQMPIYEVHLSNIHAREDFRNTSVIAPVCKGQICGFGYDSYKMALRSAYGEVIKL